MAKDPQQDEPRPERPTPTETVSKHAERSDKPAAERERANENKGQPKIAPSPARADPG